MESHPQAEPVYRPRSPGSNAFVGRQREMDELKAALEDALSGQGRLVMLAGEPGIGKTRTARELAAHATLKGVEALWGRCYAEQGAPSYWPWVQVIRSYVREHSADELRSQMGAGAADIAEVVSEVKECFPDLPPPPALEPQQARFRLFDSITTFFKRASQSQPLMLALDNLHWADRPSLLLLEFLAQEMADARLLVVGTYRDTEPGRGHPLTLTLGELTREPLFRRVLLRGLSEENVAQFIGATAGLSPPPGLVKAVHAQTEGNPLFVSQVAQLLAQEGQFTPERVAERETWSIMVPAGVRETIRKRLDGLSEVCNEVLTVASVVGREFELDLLTQLIGELSEDELLEAMEEALAAKVIEEIPQTISRYQFAHVLIQDTLAREMSAARRARLHQRIAEALEEWYGINAETHAAELAYHFVQAEPALGTEKLVKYSLLAGEQALAAYAWEEALQHFQRGLAAKRVPLTGTEPAKDAETAALLFGLGRAQVVTLPRARFDVGLLSLERSFEYYANTGDVTSAVAVAGYPIPRGFRERSKVEQRVEQGLMLVPPDSIAAGRILPLYGMELGRFENDYDRARDAFERALAIARRENDVNLQMRTLAAWAQVDYFHLHLAECLEKSLEVIDLARHADIPHLEVDGHLHALQTLIHLGDSKNAEEHAKAGLVLAERFNSRRWLASVRRCGVNLYRFLGDWGQARDLASRNLALESDEVPLFKELVSLEYELGEFGQGEVYLKQMQEVMRRTPPRPGPEYADTSLVSHFVGWITGSTEYLEIAGQAAEMVLSSPLAHPFWIEIVRTGLALRAAQTEDSALAQEQYLALAGLPGQMRGSYISAGRIMGLLAHTIGNLDQAVAHFEDALTFCRKEGFRPELAWTCHDYAESLLQRNDPGDRARAVSLLDEGLTISRELGMPPLIERVLNRLEHFGPSPAPSQAYPAGLTQREAEVLRRVAAGKSNAEIAAELVLSIRTVERHVANIYSKINSHNRAEAASFAFIHGFMSPSKTA